MSPAVLFMLAVLAVAIAQPAPLWAQLAILAAIAMLLYMGAQVPEDDTP